MKIGPGNSSTGNSSASADPSASGDVFKGRARSSVVTGGLPVTMGSPPPRPTTPAPTRRSGDGGVHHAPARVANIDAPVDVRAVSKADRRSQEGDSSASLQLSNDPSDAPKAFASVDRLMSAVFDALETGDANRVLSSSKAFVAAVPTRDLRMAKASAFSFDAHSDRWRSQLQTMPGDKLESVQRAAAGLSGRAADPVVSGIHTAASAELLQRTARDMDSEGAEFVLSGFSRDQLRELKNAASHVLDNAPQASPADEVPGTKSTRKDLEGIRDGVTRQLAIKVVQGNYLNAADALEKMPAAERDEVVWAVKWCRTGAVVVASKTEFEGAKLAQYSTSWASRLHSLESAIKELEARAVFASGAQSANSSDL